MAQLLAGTAFGQVLRLPLELPKPKQKIVKYGIMKKERITSITLSEEYNDGVIYSSEKNVYMGSYSDQTQSTLFSNQYNASKIIGIHSFEDGVMAALNNGALHTISRDEEGQNWVDKQILAGKFQPSTSKQYNRVVFDGEHSFCLVGKEVLPFLFDSSKNIVSWNGKNVANDQLDLRVPVNDMDATFFKNNNCIACAHSNNKVRVYDVRTNKQKPSADYHLKLEKVYNKVSLTNIRVAPSNDNIFYISNDLGSIYECDMRKQMQMVGKFKGISSTITDLVIHQSQLFASSLDSYVRIFNLESRQLEEKHYMNKPIYSIRVKSSTTEEPREFQQEALSDQEQNQQNEPQSKKIKKLRKRNKVNLKYLKPINWDDVPIKEELLQQAKEEYEEINSKDADSYLDENEEDGVKDEHNSDQERDSDLD